MNVSYQPLDGDDHLRRAPSGAASTEEGRGKVYSLDEDAHGISSSIVRRLQPTRLPAER